MRVPEATGMLGDPGAAQHEDLRLHRPCSYWACVGRKGDGQLRGEEARVRWRRAGSLRTVLWATTAGISKGAC